MRKKVFLASNARHSDEVIHERQKLKMMREIKDMKLMHKSRSSDTAAVMV